SAQRYAWHARWKSRSSYSFCTVASVGKPLAKSWLNSSVAMRVARCCKPVRTVVMTSSHLLDVRQTPPLLLEQRLLRTVEAEEHLVFAVGAGAHQRRFS